jgi:hypothetical protein
MGNLLIRVPEAAVCFKSPPIFTLAAQSSDALGSRGFLVSKSNGYGTVIDPTGIAFEQL